MKESFPAALAATLKYEGGYSNHPKDPGGATMRGVTQRVYDAWRRTRGLKPRSVNDIYAVEVGTIYRRQYWDAVRGDDLPAGIDAAVFDAAVNSGPVRAAKWLQAALGVSQDGHIGVVTMDAARHADQAATARAVCEARLAWLKGLKTWPTFGKGWGRRIRELQAFAATLAKQGEGQ
jgi:lysozyme family protein